MVPIVFLLYRPGDIVTSSIAIWTAVCVLAVFTTALAFILYFNIIASRPVRQTRLRERLAPFEFAGMALILSSLLIIDGRLFRR